MLQSLLSSHSLAVVVGLFTLVSLLLSGVATYLTSIGDQVPGILGTVSSALGSIVHFLNGNVTAANATTNTTTTASK